MMVYVYMMRVPFRLNSRFNFIPITSEMDVIPLIHPIHREQSIYSLPP